MASFPSTGLPALWLAIGSWLHPATEHRPRSRAQQQVQRRAGVTGTIYIAMGLIPTLIALAVVLVAGVEPVPGNADLSNAIVPGALLLVAISVFAPQAIFRAQSAARIRKILDNPTSAQRPWASSTITFNAVLVGALLAGVFIQGVLALALFGLALAIRVIMDSTRNIDEDPNARFHSLTKNFTIGFIGVVAFVVTEPLVPPVGVIPPVWPFLTAALIAMYVGLILNIITRWVDGNSSAWSFARDAVDSRRIIVALVSALIAWLTTASGTWAEEFIEDGGDAQGVLVGLAVFLVSWALLWLASLELWRREAMKTLALWAQHQTEVVGRLADGSLDPELAERAALRTTTRMAISVFGATRALSVVSHHDGRITDDFIAVDEYENAPPTDRRSLTGSKTLTMRLYPEPGHSSASGVTVGGWLRPGSFLVRNDTIVQRFTNLATQSLLVPVVASDDRRLASAFDEMFTDLNRWPSMAAFAEATSRLQALADASPESRSLVVAVYSIDDFGALAGGKFEHVAVGQVMRLALGNPNFAGHDMFLAYDDPGRIWIALGGGPVIRSSIDVLRELQTYINNHGAIPSAKLDVDVHVSVAFGYAAHQVDDFTCDGLIALARERLLSDQGARDPFAVENVSIHEITPEAIIESAETPVTAVDMLALLREDLTRHNEGDSPRFSTSIAPIVNVHSDDVDALCAKTAWPRTIGHVDVSDPDIFFTTVSRNSDTAAAAMAVYLTEAKRLLRRASLVDSNVPLLVWAPSVLINPDAGENSLANLISPTLDLTEVARTVLVFDTIPTHSGESLRSIADRGVKIAVTAGAAAAADSVDLYGWPRWGVVFPQHIIQGPSGVDSLMVQQTVSAIAGGDTKLIAVADRSVDLRDLAALHIDYVMSPTSAEITSDSDLLYQLNR